MADIVTQTVNLSAENFNMNEFARVLSDVFKQTQEEDSFFDSEEETFEETEESSFLLDSLNLLISNGDIIHNDLLNLNDSIQTMGDLLIDSILQIGKLDETNTNRLIKSQKIDEDVLLSEDEEMSFKGEGEGEGEGEDIKSPMSLKSLFFGALFAGAVNLIKNAFEGYQEGGIMGLIKSVFLPKTIFSSVGNYAVIGATIGTGFMPPIGTIIGGIIGAVTGLLIGLFRKGAFDGVISWMGEKWDSTLQLVKECFEDFIYYTKQIFLSIKSFFMDKILRNLEIGIVKYKQTLKKVFIDTPLEVLNWIGSKTQEIFENIKLGLFNSIKDILESKLFTFIPGLSGIIKTIDGKIQESEETLNEIEEDRMKREEAKRERDLKYAKEIEDVNKKYDDAVKILQDTKESLENKKLKEEWLREKKKEQEEKEYRDININNNQQIVSSTNVTNQSKRAFVSGGYGYNRK